MFERRTIWLRLGFGLALTSAVFACTPNRPAKQIETETQSAVPVSDADGIVSYDGYQVVRAQDGDTVMTAAERVGLSAIALGDFNGLPPDHRLRAGDELVLPPRPFGDDSGTAETIATAPTESTPLPPPVPTPTTPSPQNDAGAIVPPVETPTAPAETGWSIASTEAAIARATDARTDGSPGPQPNGSQPSPDEPPARSDPATPNPSQHQTGDSQDEGSQESRSDPANEIASAEANVPKIRMIPPVDGQAVIDESGTVVNFAAPAGAEVVAAADGEVLLVSPSLGGLGTIVFVRHPDDLLTLYGRIDGVVVKKGDFVSAGQKIAVVSETTADAGTGVHFEVRRGTRSLDPVSFF